MDDSAEVSDDLGSWTQVGQPGLFGQNSDYEPSLLSDFSVMLPDVSEDAGVAISERYNPDVVVQSAWKSLSSTELELPWEGGFWNRFFNPNVSAVDMLSRSLKRPAPFHAEPLQDKPKRDVVSQRVLACQTAEVHNFL